MAEEDLPTLAACGHPRQRWALLSAVLCVAATACAAFACALPHWATAGSVSFGLWETCTDGSGGTPASCAGLDAGALPCSDFLQTVRIISPIGVAYCMLTALVAFTLSLWHRRVSLLLLFVWGACLAAAFTTTLICFLLWLLLLGVKGCNAYTMDFCLWVQLAAALLCVVASVGPATSRNQRLLPPEPELPVLPYVVLDKRDAFDAPTKADPRLPVGEALLPFDGDEVPSPHLRGPMHSTTPIFTYP